MVSGPINCVKYLVFIFNLIFFLFGITLVAVGAYVQSQLAVYLDFFDTDINGPAILLIVIGLIIFMIAFFGCCGAIKENYCMVLTFSILMMVILVCQIGGAIAGFVYSSNIKELASKQMKISMISYGDEEKGGVKKTWDHIQMKLSCCGTLEPRDWTDIEGEKYAKGPPQSCCNSTKSETTTSSTKRDDCTYDSLNLNKKGCVTKVAELFEMNVYYIGAVGIALAVIQVIGVILTCFLSGGFKRKQRGL